MTPQPLHIFTKDVRHLWPEILVVLALFGAFAWSAPSGWAISEYSGAAVILAGFLHFLMPVSWLVLISRLIHDEPLVGDRQFWTSRPYSWLQLFAAKVLFLLTFIYLPFLLMQIYLLKHAGLYPTTVLPALGFNLLLLTVIVIVPITALAAVTSTFARLLLSVIGAIVLLLVLTGVVLWRNLLHMNPPQLEPIVIGLFVLLPLGALLYQYATRRTRNAQLLLLASPLLVALLILLTPAQALIQQAYPLAQGASDPKLSDVPETLRRQSPPEGRLPIQAGTIAVTLPFAVASSDLDSIYAVGGVQATIDAGSVHWVSPYQAGGAREITGGSPVSAATIRIPSEIFEKIKSAPASVHLSLAAQHFKVEKGQTWKASAPSFAVPGKGVCRFSTDDTGGPPLCRYPLKSPQLNFVKASLAAGSCSKPAAPPQESQAAIGATGSPLDFDPVVSTQLAFPSRDPDQDHHYLLCPDTPLEFTEAREQGKTRFEVDLKKVILDNYAIRLRPGEDGGARRRGPVAEPQ